MMTATMTAASAVSSIRKVTTRQLDTENKDALYRSVVSTYNNHSLYLRNLPLSSVTTDANGALMTETTNTYRLVKADADTTRCIRS